MSTSRNVARYIANGIVIIVIAFGCYVYRAQLGRSANYIRTLIFHPAPCTEPITYSIGTFDTRFGITKTQFLSDIERAQSVWNKAMDKTLFEYHSTGGTLPVNLVYDNRQKATDQLETIGGTIQDNKGDYNALTASYDSLLSQYKQEKDAIAVDTAAYKTKQAAYDQQVQYWNSKGGAPKSEYAALETQRQELNADATALNAEVRDFNTLVDNMNATADRLNQMAHNLNLNVQQYNKIGASNGPEFDEGEYVSDENGERINVYQFDSNARLIRLLTHEFGHALGLQHVDGASSIMYRLNESTNEVPTAEDLTELHRVCG